MCRSNQLICTGTNAAGEQLGLMDSTRHTDTRQWLGIDWCKFSQQRLSHVCSAHCASLNTGMLLWSLNLANEPALDNWPAPVNPVSLFALTGVSLNNPSTLNRWLEKERELRDSVELFRARGVAEGW